MKEATQKTHNGKVVNLVGDKLTTTCSQGNRYVHTVAGDAKVTCDGQASTLEDLKAGTHVRVTLHKDDILVATAVESGKHIPAPAWRPRRPATL